MFKAIVLLYIIEYECHQIYTQILYCIPTWIIVTITIHHNAFILCIKLKVTLLFIQIINDNSWNSDPRVYFTQITFWLIWKNTVFTLAAILNFFKWSTLLYYYSFYLHKLLRKLINKFNVASQGKICSFPKHPEGILWEIYSNIYIKSNFSP